MQKSANHRLRPAVVGDVSGHVADSPAPRDFAHEAGQGRRLCFVPDEAAPAQRWRPTTG
ncbi:DUF4180 domain-containing protein [Streptomyces sp. NPDC101166]|uniref:DUF4180 domain-containing protein n=1 Tax=Streptomyces sp. NPDC101166 TaxID=3366120 RepID=UPI00382EB3D5